MKAKSIQRLIQIGAFAFLIIWIVARAVQHLDFNSFIIVGVVGAFSLARLLFKKGFPQTAARCRIYKKLVWFFISLSVIFTVLSCVNFNASMLAAIADALVFSVSMWCLTYMELQKLEEQLNKEQIKMLRQQRYSGLTI